MVPNLIEVDVVPGSSGTQLLVTIGPSVQELVMGSGVELEGPGESRRTLVVRSGPNGDLLTDYPDVVPAGSDLPKLALGGPGPFVFRAPAGDHGPARLCAVFQRKGRNIASCEGIQLP